MSGQWLPQGIANNLNKGVRVRTIKQSRIFDFVTEYVDFSLTILVWEIVWEVFSVIFLVYFSKKLTNLVCSYCWECHFEEFIQILIELSFYNREFYRSCHNQLRFVAFSPSTICVTQFLSLLPRIVILSLWNEKSTIPVIDK